MNRYPIWIYITVAVAVLLGALYTLPNFFGEVPAVQISSARSTVQVDSGLMGKIEATLRNGGVQAAGITQDANSIRVRLQDTDTQIKARDLISQDLNPNKEDPD